MVKYAFVTGWSPDLDPQIAGRTLAVIAKQQGHITPQKVVDDSRPVTAPLHSYFEWNNQKAADSFRLDQAAKLIRCVRVVIEERASGENIVQRPFIRINATGTEEAGYYPAAVVMSNASMREQAIAEALSHLNRAKDRLREYRELERQFTAIETVQRELVFKTRQRSGRRHSSPSIL